MSSKSPGVNAGAKRPRSAAQPNAAAASSTVFLNQNQSQLSLEGPPSLRAYATQQQSRPATTSSEDKPKKAKKVKKPVKDIDNKDVRAAVANVGLLPPGSLPAPSTTPAAASSSRSARVPERSRLAPRAPGVSPLQGPNASTVSLPLATSTAGSSASLRPQLNARSRSSSNLSRPVNPPLSEQPLRIAPPMASTSSQPTPDSNNAAPRKKKRKRPKVVASSSTASAPIVAVTEPPVEIRPEPVLRPSEQQIVTISNIDDAEEEAQNLARQEYQAAMSRRDVYEDAGLGAELDEVAPPAFERPPPPWSYPLEDPPIYYSPASSPGSDTASLHMPEIALPESFDVSAVPSREAIVEREMDRMWHQDVNDGVSLAERIERDQARRRLVNAEVEVQIVRSQVASTSSVPTAPVPIASTSAQASASAIASTSSGASKPPKARKPRAKPTASSSSQPYTSTSAAPPSTSASIPASTQASTSTSVPLPACLPASVLPALEAGILSQTVPLTKRTSRNSIPKSVPAPSSSETSTSQEPAVHGPSPLGTTSSILASLFSSRPFGQVVSSQPETPSSQALPKPSRALPPQPATTAALTSSEAQAPIATARRSSAQSQRTAPIARPALDANPPAMFLPTAPGSSIWTPPERSEISDLRNRLDASLPQVVKTAPEEALVDSSDEEQQRNTPGQYSSTSSIIEEQPRRNLPPPFQPELHPAIPPEVPSPPAGSSSADSYRREEGRRHSALLVRPLSVRRKPPLIPAPRRWAAAAKAFESARPQSYLTSVDESSSATETKSDDWASRLSEKQRGKQRMSTDSPPLPGTPSLMAYQSNRNSLLRPISPEVAHHTLAQPTAASSSSSDSFWDSDSEAGSSNGSDDMPILQRTEAILNRSNARRSPVKPPARFPRSLPPLPSTPTRDSAEIRPPLRPLPNTPNTGGEAQTHGRTRSQEWRYGRYWTPSLTTVQQNEVSRATAKEDQPSRSYTQEPSAPLPRTSRLLPSDILRETASNGAHTPSATSENHEAFFDAAQEPDETMRAEPAQEDIAEQPSQVEEAAQDSTALQNGVSRQRSVTYTDFDALLARIDREQQAAPDDGRHYEDYLTVQEVLGTARPTNVVTNADWDLLSVARVELESRRVDKNGKVKTKLACAGVRVNKCTICLTQFKANEMACIFPECVHCFHRDCMVKWLSRSKNCPTCRQVLPVA